MAETWNGRIDILVNNAAFFGGMGAWRPFDEWTVEDWDKMQDVNVRGMWFCARAVFPYMKAQGYGKIINLSSSTFFEGVPGLHPLHHQQGRGHRFHPVPGERAGRVRHPGERYRPWIHPLRCPARADQGFPGLVRAQPRQAGSHERNEMPEDLAGPAFFLASTDSDFMTCQTLLVDGGVTPH